MNILNLKDVVISFSEKNIIEYLSVLNCLTNVYNHEDELNFMIKNFKKYVLNLESNINIFVVYQNNNIIGSGTLIIEQKLIHGFGKIGHLEDIVIDSKYQGQGLGKHLVNFLINKAKENNCYKVIFGCNNDKLNFYLKNQPDKSTKKIINQIGFYFNNVWKINIIKIYMNQIVCVSGYFVPIHIGHLEYFKKSKKLGDKLMVIVNNDEQAILKKVNHLCL